MKKTKIDTIRLEIGQQIKARRNSKGLGQTAFSKMIGKDQQRIPSLEKGKLKAIDTYIAAVTALGGKVVIEWD